MPLHPNVRRCTHIQVTGHRCGSPALKQEYFCYFHTRMIKGVQTRVDSQIHPVALIENAEAIQAALMHMIDAVLKGTIDNKRAALVLKALYIAVRNSRNVHFRIRQDDMVREVPNYAHQYLTEHPELNTDCPPDVVAATPVAAAPPKQESHEQETHQEKQCHPERARPLRESKDPHSAHAGSGATGNSPNLSERNREKAWGEDIPPLTTRQSEHWNEIKKLEASIEGAMRGDWRELRTVFDAVGLTPRKPPSPQRAKTPQNVKRR
jgi:Mg-chelatase subunit ChlI